MMAKTERIRIFLVTDLNEDLCRRIGVTRISCQKAALRAADQRDVAVITNASMLIR
jgi:hypothetical protein